MGVITNHIKTVADLLGGRDGGYSQAVYEAVKEVQVSPLSEVFTPDEIRMIRRALKPKQKQCYANATKLCGLMPERVEYCEGFVTVSGLLPLEHAFNKVGDKYVDITMELALGRNVTEEQYATIIECGLAEVYRVASKTGVYGGVFTNRFRELHK